MHYIRLQVKQIIICLSLFFLFAGVISVEAEPIQAGPDLPIILPMKYENIVFGDGKVCKSCHVSDTAKLITEIRTNTWELYPLRCGELVLRDNKYYPDVVGKQEDGVNCRVDPFIKTYAYFKFWGDQYYERYQLDQYRESLGNAFGGYMQAFPLAPIEDRPLLNARLALLSFAQTKRYVNYWHDEKGALLCLDQALFFLKWNGPIAAGQALSTDGQPMDVELQKMVQKLQLSNEEARLSWAQQLENENEYGAAYSEYMQILETDPDNKAVKIKAEQISPLLWQEHKSVHETDASARLAEEKFQKSVTNRVRRQLKVPELYSPTALIFRASVTLCINQ